ncbi:unnamed protein product, partial [Oppiella nova]
MSSIPTFIDISESEQCEELREYLESLGAVFTKSETFIGELKQIIAACDVLFREGAKESDVESVLNSVVSLLIVSVPQSSQESSQLIHAFCEQTLKPKPAKQSLVCLRVLKNLFGGLQDIVDLRFRVYVTLVR